MIKQLLIDIKKIIIANLRFKILCIKEGYVNANEAIEFKDLKIRGK